MGTWIWIWICICGGFLSPKWKWFRWPERLVIFTFGLVFSKGLMTLVLQNLSSFLTDSLNLKLKEAITIVNLQEGLRNMLQICVALCIDAYLGYRWMLILSSLLYSAGLFLLALSVPGGERCPSNCFKELKHTSFWEGLTLVIVGGAAQVIPLYALSFEQTRVAKIPEDYEPARVQVGCFRFRVKIGGWRNFLQKVIRWLLFLFLRTGALTSVYGFFFYYYKWQQHFFQSAVAIIIGLLWFLCGFPFYGPRRLQRSPLSIMLHTLIAAWQKRHLKYQINLDEEDQNHSLTDHLELLNSAAVKESPADDNLRRRWRLCTVTEVEQTKLLLDIIPMSATFIVYGMVKSLGNTFFIEQADRMHGGISLVVLQLIQFISKRAVNEGYKMVFEKRIQRIKRRYSDGVKIGIGMLTSILCCAVASQVESKRLKALKKKGLLDNPEAEAPMSASWLLLQFIFLGAMEGLAGDGIVNFFGHYAPDSRRYAPVFTSSLTGFGTILSIGFIAIIDYYSRFRYKESWIGESVNESRLDLIYRAYVMLAVLNCFIYAYVASSYSYDNIIGKPENEQEIPVLEVKQQQEEEKAAGDPQNKQEQEEYQLQRMSVR
ncbi:protein NRT1/ PTR FAMILY 5.5-like [Gossypium arboreum]|nr:protein NRT1/ PTR FAMILY 5.5-like [Gossypium arboreum]